MWAFIPEIAAALGSGISTVVAATIAFRLRGYGKKENPPTVVVTRQSGDVQITVSGADAEQVRRTLASLDAENGRTAVPESNGDEPQAGARREQ
ncbi:hypothetical protein CCS38_33040 [Streptomyces purpurogeneiscleroticus]|nr:hypothetical protein [Streptomyces purpurogeneiscleroticus]